MKVSDDRNTVTRDDGAEFVFVEGAGAHCYTCALEGEGGDAPCDLWCQGMYRDDCRNGNFQLKEVAV